MRCLPLLSFQPVFWRAAPRGPPCSLSAGVRAAPGWAASWASLLRSRAMPWASTRRPLPPAKVSGTSCHPGLSAGTDDPDPLWGFSNVQSSFFSLVEEQARLIQDQPDQPQNPKVLRIAIIGAPNAGKSTLSNQLLGRKVKLGWSNKFRLLNCFF